MTLTWLGILFTVALTSTLSGILGMGGGMLLMGVLAVLLPTGPAMVLHGIAQLAANGSRTLLHIRHAQWKILPYYGIGAFGALAAFRFIEFIPERWLVYLLMGCLPWLAVYGKKLMVLNIEKPIHAGICGGLVTILQLTCGVSGPALDIFYLHSTMSRHRIVSSKALTQALGHALKLYYYGSLTQTQDMGLSRLQELSVCAVALLGTAVGARFLNQTNDQSFQLWSRRFILLIGLVYLLQGIYELGARP